MSGYTRNAVYTAVRNAVATDHPTAYITSTFVAKPASFPAVFARQNGRYQPRRNVTLAHDDNQWRDTFELQVFSNLSGGAQSEAYGIFDSADAEMKRLGYILDLCEPIDNIDATIFRLVARWHRVTGGADQMPT